MCQIKTAEIYNEATSIKQFGNVKEVKITKEYNKNGHLIKVTRIEKYNHNDASVSIKEIYDDGHDIKVKEFINSNGSQSEPTIDLEDKKSKVLRELRQDYQILWLIFE